MISETRFNETKDMFNKSTATLSDDKIALYADMFEIIGSYIHNKLTTAEIVNTYTFLRELILGKLPKLAVAVKKDDRIRVQLRIMEEIRLIKDKLTDDEKQFFAFCVWYSTFVEIYDKATGTSKRGIYDFTSIEHVKAEFEYEKAQFPGFFMVTQYEDHSDQADYGYSLENPIMLTSIPVSYAYLDLLQYNGKKVSYSRNGSTTNKMGIVDIYTLSYEEKKLFSKKIIEKTIYIFPYSDKMILKAPKGFSLDKSKLQ